MLTRSIELQAEEDRGWHDIKGRGKNNQPARVLSQMQYCDQRCYHKTYYVVHMILDTDHSLLNSRGEQPIELGVGLLVDHRAHQL